MKNTSKGRICATSAPISDGAPLSQIFRYNANPVTFRQGMTVQHPQEQPQPHAPQVMTIDDVLGRLREATDLVTALKQERAERERLEAILTGIKKQLDGLHSKSEPILLPTLF